MAGGRGPVPESAGLAGGAAVPMRAGVLPGAGGWAVAVDDLGLVPVPCGGGAVGVQDEGPAHPVDHDLVVVAAEQDAVFEAGFPAAGLVGQVVDLTCRRGLGTATRILP